MVSARAERCYTHTPHSTLCSRSRLERFNYKSMEIHEIASVAPRSNVSALLRAHSSYGALSVFVCGAEVDNGHEMRGTCTETAQTHAFLTYIHVIFKIYYSIRIRIRIFGRCCLRINPSQLRLLAAFEVGMMLDRVKVAGRAGHETRGANECRR